MWAARSKKMPTAATSPRLLRVAVKRKMKDMRKARSKAASRATTAVDPAAVAAAARWRSMWTLPRDMTFKHVSGVPGVPVKLLLRENPFDGGPHRGSILLEEGTVVFTGDDSHKPRHPLSTLVARRSYMLLPKLRNGTLLSRTPLS